jgi:RNA polymerase sigma factor (sigma-70 family)
MDEATFQQVLQGVVAGDSVATERLAGFVLAFAQEMLRSGLPIAVRRMPREDAEELPGRAWIRVLANLAHFRGSQVNFRAYVAVAIHNLAKDFWRAQSRLPESIPIDAGLELPDPAAAPGEGEVDALIELIDAMGQPCRSLIIWRFEGREMKAVIEELGVEFMRTLLGTTQREIVDLVRVMSRRTLACLRMLRDQYFAEGA